MSAPKFEDVKSLLGDGPSAQARANQRARLVAATPGRGSRWLMGLALASGLAAVAIVVLVLRPVPGVPGAPSPIVVLTREIQGVDEAGAPLVSGLRVTRAATWRFTEKSEVQIATNTTVSLASLSNELVDVDLQAGRVDLQVTHGTGRLWRIVSGRYETRVVGTRLHVERHGDQVEVGVTEGLVEVRGPDNGVVHVAAGETWSSPAPALEPTPPAAAPESGLTIPPAPVEQPKRPVVKAASWSVLFARGDYEAALLAAERDGVMAHAETLDPLEVMSLATASRLTNRPMQAARLLHLAMSKPGEHRPEAAFLLGRIELQQGRTRQAAEAFETSVTLAPSGPFGEEAGARLLEALDALGQTEKSRTAATQYLERFPEGAAVERANKVLHK